MNKTDSEQLLRFLEEILSIQPQFLIVILFTLILLLSLMILLRIRRKTKTEKKKPSEVTPSLRSDIQQLLKKRDYAKAGEKLLEHGRYREAVTVFQKGNLPARAAEAYLKQGQPDHAAILFERAGELAKATEIYVKLKQYDRVEKLMKDMGRTDELANLYEEKGELAWAAKTYLENQQYVAAGNILKRIGKPLEAAEAFLQSYEFAKHDWAGPDAETVQPETRRLGLETANLFMETNQLLRASEIYLALYLYPEAAECWVKLGKHERAAKLMEEQRQWEKAEQYWKLAGDEKNAARVAAERLVDEGEFPNAALKFEEAGDFQRAAEMYSDLEQPEKAAEMYEKGGEYSLAAAFYRQAGMFEKAAHVFEKLGKWPEAISCYSRAGLTEKELALRERIGDYIGIAEGLYKQGKVDEALRTIEEIDQNHPRYRFHLGFKGKVYLDQGEPQKALEYLNQAVQMSDRLSGRDIEAIYNLAVVSDQLNIESNALDILERMLLQDQVEKSVIQKAQEVKKALTERAFHKMPQSTESFTDDFLSKKEQSGEGSKGATRYVPLKEIGRGGMGIVYQAKDTALDRTVALKILPASLKENKRAVQTFLREARAAAALNHPNIVTVHDAGIQSGEYYIAMEYIEGETLKAILKKKKKLNYASVFEVLKQLLSALDYAHSQKIVHRDLTTNNIMWTRQKIVKIMDFGLAKVMKELISEQSIIGGTPSFMSPEQTLGNPVDHRTDIYSLGVSVYEMCLGELPFTEGDLGYHHLHTSPPIPKKKDPDMPKEINDLILKCMQKNPVDRFQKVAEMKKMIEKYL